MCVDYLALERYVKDLKQKDNSVNNSPQHTQKNFSKVFVIVYLS